MMKCTTVPAITITWNSSWYEKTRGHSLGQFVIRMIIPMV